MTFVMKPNYIISSLLLCLLLASCSAPGELESTVEIIDLANCSNKTTLLKLSAEGGYRPYIYQVKHKRDNKIVYTEVSQAFELDVALEELNEIYYELIIVDDELFNHTTDFEVRPEGAVTIDEILQIENDGIMRPLAEVKVSLYKEEKGVELLTTVTTDENGRFILDNISAGIYSLGFEASGKIDEFQLEAVQEFNNRIRVKRGTNQTVPFVINCHVNLDMEFIFKR